MTKGTRGSFNKKPEEEGGASVSAPAVLSEDKPVTVNAEVAESITSTNADSVIFTPDGSTPEETTPKAAFALPFRPAIPMDSVIEGLSSLEIKETQQGSQQGSQEQLDQQASPEPPISKSKKRRMKPRQRKKQQHEEELKEELKKKQEQGASLGTKPQPVSVAIIEEKKPSTQVAHAHVMDLFNDYFRTRSLANWQRLCIDLGLEDKNISTVTQCRKALGTVNVNIYDFLAAIEERKLLPPDQQKAPLDIKKFDSVNQLFKYSEKHKRIFSKTAAKAGDKGSPLRGLLRGFFGPGGYRGKKNKGSGLPEGGVMV